MGPVQRPHTAAGMGAGSTSDGPSGDLKRSDRLARRILPPLVGTLAVSGILFVAGAVRMIDAQQLADAARDSETVQRVLESGTAQFVGVMSVALRAAESDRALMAALAQREECRELLIPFVHR